MYQDDFIGLIGAYFKRLVSAKVKPIKFQSLTVLYSTMFCPPQPACAARKKSGSTLHIQVKICPLAQIWIKYCVSVLAGNSCSVNVSDT